MDVSQSQKGIHRALTDLNSESACRQVLRDIWNCLIWKVWSENY
jgi:hypothetical protein